MFCLAFFTPIQALMRLFNTYQTSIPFHHRKRKENFVITVPKAKEKKKKKTYVNITMSSIVASLICAGLAISLTNYENRFLSITVLSYY